jgi:hypothetical protein
MSYMCLLAYSDIQDFVVLHNYLYVLVLCCDVRYDSRIKLMFELSLPTVVCKRIHA